MTILTIHVVGRRRCPKVLVCAEHGVKLLHNYVQMQFDQGNIAPLVTDKTGDISSLNNYRAITILSIISKSFEHILLGVCSGEYLNSDNRQFGFEKKHRGCARAKFAVRSTMNVVVLVMQQH